MYQIRKEFSIPSSNLGKAVSNDIIQVQFFTNRILVHWARQQLQRTMVKMTMVLQIAVTWSAAAQGLVASRAFAFSYLGRTSRRTISTRPGGIPASVVSPPPMGRSAWTRYYHTSRLVSLATPSTLADMNNEPSTTEKKVPITLLSGFLGTGKTSTLQHLLENTQGLKIGVIVNDVASVNIDAKLVSGSNRGVVELQNGCACCSLAEELLTSVDALLGSNDNKRRDLDAVVVELSGVADPIAIKSNWQNAKVNGHPVTNRAEVAQIVTLVDASTFGTDWMTWDVAGERQGWVDPNDECAAQRKVPELLAEQVEAANVILINKIDLAGPEQVKVASALAKSMNKDAVLEEVLYGKVAPQQILRTLSHDQDHNCHDPDCNDTSHSHSHDHGHAETCSDPDCMDKSHSHDHKSHEESHSHNHAHDSTACTDPDCSDPTHTHSHSHSHATSTDNLGIVNFVYRANRPFNTKKLLTLLNQWPVPIKDDLDLSVLQDAQLEGYEIDGQSEIGSPFVGVLRSKGFCWFAPTRWSGPKEDVWRHDTAMYWSHAGKHFGISSAGKFWATISREQMKQYFADNIGEYERILREDFVSEEFGDRRQEIVFIGVNIKEDDISFALDQCLLTEKGMDRYRQELQNYMNTVFTSPAGGPSLFDVGGVDHMDVK